MGTTRWIATAIALAAASPLAAQPVTLDGVAQALGGKERVLGVRTVVLEGTGSNLNFGQNQTPYAENTFEVTSFRRSIDFANRRWLLDQTRVPRFTTGNMAPQRQRTGLDGAPNGVAYNIGNNNVMGRAGAQAAADRMHELVYYPVGFLMAAYRAGTEVTVESAPGNQARIRINPAGVKYAMLVDRRTKLPTRIERIVDQPMLGDAVLATEFSDWSNAAGLTVPGRIVQRLMDRWTLSDYRVSATRVNEDVGNLAATDSVRALTPGAPPAPTIAVEEIAPGVWSIAGQSHHSIAIEQARRIVLVEAPQNESRTLAAIAAARALRPEKPVDLLINTHHHFDHSGGLRAAISEGLPIMTHQGNRDFYERYVAVGQHFIQPDALSRNPKQARLIAISDKHVIADSLRTVEVYPIEGNAHSGSMLVVYLPAERVLIQADLYNPPAANAVNPVFPFLPNLLENIQRRGLQVDRVVGIHGRPVAFSELQAAASRAP
jgi:glyoxylase-like metal-dependent hydrolase (beta-lactamase superfamily II)